MSILGYFLLVVLVGTFAGEVVIHFLPDEYSFPLNPRFVGVSMYERDELDDDGNPVAVYDKDGFYSVDDTQLEEKILEYEENEVPIKAKYFLFWQTAYDQGYDPVNIASFSEPDELLDKIELFLTIGPVLIFEIAINAIYRYFLPALLILLYFQYLARIKFPTGKPFWHPYYLDVSENK